MKKLILGCSLVFLVSASVQAQDLLATMKVTQAKGSFQRVQKADLRLSNKSTMSIKLGYDEGDSTYYLKIYDTQKDQNGCTKYRAKLRRSEEEERTNGFWFFVDLVDYSSCDASTNKWQAFVRAGCRCCGIEDSAMTLSGDPQKI